jgi:hypothetical protein
MGHRFVPHGVIRDRMAKRDERIAREQRAREIARRQKRPLRKADA